MPDSVEDPLRSLLFGMLDKDPYKRFNLQQIRQHCWFNKKPPKTGQMVPIPPLKGDEWHNMTTIPYLMDHYYDLSENVEDEKFYTEHQLNEKRNQRTQNQKEHSRSNGQAGTSSKRRWKKPISCMTVRNFPGCKQS